MTTLGSKGPPAANPYTPAVKIQTSKYYMVAYWLEAMIYGGYVPLFMFAFSSMRKRSGSEAFPARFMLFSISLMFLLITISTSWNLYILIKVYVVRPQGAYDGTYQYLRGLPMVIDQYVPTALIILLGWISDVIMIHRCFCVYQRSLKVIVLPCLIFGASLASGLFTLIWYQNPISPKSRVAQPIIGLFFPLGFAQHFITTSLIVYRIYTHHQTMSRAGLHSSQTSRGQPNLLIMLRIILESAMIWTVEMLIITALLYLKNPAQVIVKHASIPCSGIVFALVAVRMHFERRNASAAASSSQRQTAVSLPPRSWQDHRTTHRDIGTGKSLDGH